jgi:ABC-2 type transport system permease protein
MRTLRRYLRLLTMQVRTSTIAGMQYRWDFVVEGLMGLVFAGLALVPLWIYAGTARTIPGWTFGEMVIVVGWFTLLKGLLEGAVNPALMAVVDHIRQGTLDFVLLKPADAQFMVSTAKVDPWKAIDVVTGLGILAGGFWVLGRWPHPAHVAASLVLLVAACLVLYALFFVVVSAAFWVVRLDNLAYLFMSIFDFARWPVTLFRGGLRIFFTFVIPIALMTTYPSLALLGRLSFSTGVAAVAGGVAFLLGARLVWQRAIGHYTSASS